MKRYMLIPIAVVIVLFVGLLVVMERGDAVATKAVPMQTVTDATGERVTIPVHPKRVVILNSSNVEMYYAAGGTVVGRPMSSYYTPELRKKLTGVPYVGTIHSPNMETVIGLQPDLVIGVNVPYNSGIRPQLAQAGIPLYINNLNTYEDVLTMLRFYGNLANTPDVANAAVAKIEEGYTKVVQAAAQKDGPRTLIIFGSPGSFSMATSTSFSGNLLNLLHGHNIADGVPGLEGDFVPLSMEYIIKADPEVIFFISMTPKSDSINIFKREMQESDVWRDVSAVRNGRIYYLSGGLFSVNPGTPIVEALQIMYTDLYGKEGQHGDR